MAKCVSEIVGDSDTQQSLESHMTGTTELAFATSGDATKNRNDPFLSCCPRWPRQVNSDCRISVTCRLRYCANLCQCKHGFIERYVTYSKCGQNLTCFIGQANWVKMASPRDKLAALVSYSTKKFAKL